MNTECSDQWVQSEVARLRSCDAAAIYADMRDDELACLTRLRWELANHNAIIGYPVEEIYTTLCMAQECGMVEILVDDNDEPCGLRHTDPDEAVMRGPIWDPYRREVRYAPAVLN